MSEYVHVQYMQLSHESEFSESTYAFGSFLEEVIDEEREELCRTMIHVQTVLHILGQVQGMLAQAAHVDMHIHIHCTYTCTCTKV